jgi:ABC-type branched-subunit amino acid transport system ATPase component
MTPLLEVENVTKTFGGLSAVVGASMAAERGTIVALIGPNGAGKTTLFNCITGFEVPDSGRVVFDGNEIQGLAPWRVARRGLVRTFQTPVGFSSLSVWDNVMTCGAPDEAESLIRGILGRRAWKSAMDPVAARGEQVLRELGLWEHRHRLARDLAPGEQKLVEFARQLVSDPQMLLLDEPAAGIEPTGIGRLQALMRSLRGQGTSIVVIDHNLGFILGIADVVYVLASGAVLAYGPPDQIAKDARVAETYLGGSVPAVPGTAGTDAPL